MEENDYSQFFEEIRDLVTSYARLHHEQLQEAATILELALWNAMIIRSRNDKQDFKRLLLSGAQVKTFL